MTKPLALLVYENLLSGNQLRIRLQDLGYRVQTMSDTTDLIAFAQQEKPMVVLIDLVSTNSDTCAAIADIKKNPATVHIPILAFSGEQHAELQKAAREAGATLVASDAAILPQLPHLLEQLLRVD
ncbi:MAG: hypothetical protein M1608_06095 [Candidatus Omnitrophica bacterium]|nr:hypothetical protein [Candidatus Omnitrophota bacterium]